MQPKPLGATKDHRCDLEAGELRALLDRLSSALASPRLPGKAWAAQSLQDRTPILDSLRLVVGAVHGREAPVLSQPVAWDPNLGPKISRLTTQLRDTYLARVTSEVGSGKAVVLRRLLSHPVPDLLAILGKTDEENAHSDVIRWLLDPREAKTIAPAALSALVKRLRPPMEWQKLISNAVRHHALSVRREYAIRMEDSDEEGQGRIDLLISGPGFRLVIENKVGSEEHDSQTELYWQWLDGQPGLTLKGAMFLTPMGLHAENRNFKPLSYMDLLNCLLEGPAQTPVEKVEETVLASYVKTLAAGVLRQELYAIGRTGGQS